MSDTTIRDAKARNLCARINSERRTETELDVIDLLLEGIERHEDEYGGADAETDGRDCLDERDQEMQDGLFYHLLDAVKRRARRRSTVLAAEWNGSFEPPTPSSTFDLRDDGTDKLAVHEILTAFEEQPTGEWASKDFDVSDVEEGAA
jgi:hypothetical protein